MEIFNLNLRLSTNEYLFMHEKNDFVFVKNTRQEDTEK